MSKELSFKILLKAETGQFVQATKQSEQSVKAMFAQIQQQAGNVKLQSVKQEINSVNQEIGNISKVSNQAGVAINGLKFGLTALVSAMGAVGLGIGVQSLANTADSYTNLTAKVKIATEQTGSFTQAMSGIQSIALATNSNLEETANLFTKLDTVGRAMGMTTQQSLDLTKTVTQAIQLGGGSAQASEAAIMQFNQAMQGGVLRGEEFNSIMENGYGLAEALADGLGVTTGELRKMAENGELTSERVIKAISSQAKAIDEKYAKMPTTIGNALQRIQTQWQILIGEFDQANGGSAAVAQFLVKFADSLAHLESVIDDIGHGFAWVGEQLQQIDQSTIDALKATLKTAYDTVKNLISTVMDLGETFVSLGSSVLDIGTIFTSAFTSGQKEASGLETVINTIRLALGALSDGATAVNIGFKTLVGGLQFLSAGLLSFQAKVQDFLGFDTLAEKSQQASDRIFAQAQKNLSQANQLALDFKSQSVAVWDDIHKTKEQRDAEHLANAKTRMTELLALNQKEAEAKKVTEQEKLKAVQEYATLAVQANKGVIDGTMQADLLAKGYIVTLDSAGKVAVETAQKVQNATQNQQKVLDDARKAAQALELDLDVSLNRVSEKFQTQAGNLDKLVLGLDKLGAKGEQVGNTMFEAWNKWLSSAKSQAELDLAKQKLQQFEKQGVFSTKQVELGLDAIRRANAKIPSELSETEQAFERLGIKTKEQLKLSAELALSDFQRVRESGQATADQLKQAYERVLQAAQASGDATAIASAKAQASLAGIKLEADNAGDMIVNSMNTASQSVNNLSQTAYNATGGFDALAKSADEATAKAEQAIEKANQASQAGEKGGKLGTTSNTYHSIESIVSQLKSKGYDDAQAYAKATQVFKEASQKMIDWAGSNNMLRQLASNTINQHGVTNEAMYHAMKKVGEQAVAMNAHKALQEKQAQQQKEIAEQVKQIAPTVSQPVTPRMTQSVDRVVKLQFDVGGKTAELMGTHDNANSLESMFQQLEMLKRRS